MKKTLSVILLLALCLSLCACGGNKETPRERLNDEVKQYISENYRIEMGNATSVAVDVDIDSVADKSENEWKVLGTYTVNIKNKNMSAMFILEASYDEESDKFTFSQERFGDFK